MTNPQLRAAFIHQVFLDRALASAVSRCSHEQVEEVVAALQKLESHWKYFNQSLQDVLFIICRTSPHSNGKGACKLVKVTLDDSSGLTEVRNICRDLQHRQERRTTKLEKTETSYNCSYLCLPKQKATVLPLAAPLKEEIAVGWLSPQTNTLSLPSLCPRVLKRKDERLARQYWFRGVQPEQGFWDSVVPFHERSQWEDLQLQNPKWQEMEHQQKQVSQTCLKRNPARGEVELFGLLRGGHQSYRITQIMEKTTVVGLLRQLHGLLKPPLYVLSTQRTYTNSRPGQLQRFPSVVELLHHPPCHLQTDIERMVCLLDYLSTMAHMCVSKSPTEPDSGVLDNDIETTFANVVQADIREFRRVLLRVTDVEYSLSLLELWELCVAWNGYFEVVASLMASPFEVSDGEHTRVPISLVKKRIPTPRGVARINHLITVSEMMYSDSNVYQKRRGSTPSSCAETHSCRQEWWYPPWILPYDICFYYLNCCLSPVRDLIVAFLFSPNGGTLPSTNPVAAVDRFADFSLDHLRHMTFPGNNEADQVLDWIKPLVVLRPWIPCLVDLRCLIALWREIAKVKASGLENARNPKLVCQPSRILDIVNPGGTTPSVATMVNEIENGKTLDRVTTSFSDAAANLEPQEERGACLRLPIHLQPCFYWTRHPTEGSHQEGRHAAGVTTTLPSTLIHDMHPTSVALQYPRWTALLRPLELSFPSLCVSHPLVRAVLPTFRAPVEQLLQNQWGGTLDEFRRYMNETISATLLGRKPCCSSRCLPSTNFVQITLALLREFVLFGNASVMEKVVASFVHFARVESPILMSCSDLSAASTLPNTGVNDSSNVDPCKGLADECELLTRLLKNALEDEYLLGQRQGLPPLRLQLLREAQNVLRFSPRPIEVPGNEAGLFGGSYRKEERREIVVELATLPPVVDCAMKVASTMTKNQQYHAETRGDQIMKFPNFNVISCLQLKIKIALHVVRNLRLSTNTGAAWRKRHLSAAARERLYFPTQRVACQLFCLERIVTCYDIWLAETVVNQEWLLLERTLWPTVPSVTQSACSSNGIERLEEVADAIAKTERRMEGRCGVSSTGSGTISRCICDIVGTVGRLLTAQEDAVRRTLHLVNQTTSELIAYCQRRDTLMTTPCVEELTTLLDMHLSKT